MSQHIYLSGYRGTGKTTVGAQISRGMDIPLVDLDEKVESDSGKTIREIFDQGGETMFRDLESDALREVASDRRSVVSLGGGAILRKSNRDLIRETGICLWLDCDAETLAGRIRDDQSTSQRRPSLTSRGLIDEIAPLLQERMPLYKEVATARIDTRGKSIDQVTSEAIRFLNRHCFGGPDSQPG